MNISRKRRVARLVQQVLGDAFLRSVHDPALRGLIVTRVDMPPDLKSALVYYELLGGREPTPEVKTGLETARPYLQSLLARQTGLRNTPILRFEHDAELQDADHIVSLIDALEVPPLPEEDEEKPEENEEVGGGTT